MPMYNSVVEKKNFENNATREDAFHPDQEKSAATPIILRNSLLLRESLDIRIKRNGSKGRGRGKRKDGCF